HRSDNDVDERLSCRDRYCTRESWRVITGGGLSRAGCDGVADGQRTNGAASAGEAESASILPRFCRGGVCGRDVNDWYRRSADSPGRSNLSFVICRGKRAIYTNSAQQRNGGVIQSSRIIKTRKGARG